MTAVRPAVRAALPIRLGRPLLEFRMICLPFVMDAYPNISPEFQ
jgi:hypothetical protein